MKSLTCALVVLGSLSIPISSDHFWTIGLPLIETTLCQQLSQIDMVFMAIMVESECVECSVDVGMIIGSNYCILPNVDRKLLLDSHHYTITLL